MLPNRCNQKIPFARLETTINQLDKLHKKPKSEFTLRETIYQLRHKLSSALKKGYSYYDLSQILKSQNIIISPRTLQQYLTDTKKRAVSKPRSCSEVSDKSSTNSTKDNASPQDSLNTNTEQLQKALLNNRKSNLYTTSSDPTTDTEEKVANTFSAQDKNIKRKQKGLSGSTEDLSNEFNQY